MKGIVLAGGSGTRLAPLTNVVSKQLLPVYNKPLVYYPLSVLMLAGIREILIISAPDQLASFKGLLGDGSQFGIQLSYAIQEKPEGIAQAFLIGEEFIGNSSVALCLGDNIFHGSAFETMLSASANLQSGAHVYAYRVQDPERYGVISFYEDGKTPHHIEEKPKNPSSYWALTGLYFYDNDVVRHAKTLKKSERNELEITDLHKIYLAQRKLIVNKLSRGFSWLDAGTFDSLLEASNLVATLEKRQGLKICDPYDVAEHKKWI